METIILIIRQVMSCFSMIQTMAFYPPATTTFLTHAMLNLTSSQMQNVVCFYYFITVIIIIIILYVCTTVSLVHTFMTSMYLTQQRILHTTQLAQMFKNLRFSARTKEKPYNTTILSTFACQVHTNCVLISKILLSMSLENYTENIIINQRVREKLPREPERENEWKNGRRERKIAIMMMINNKNRERERTRPNQLDVSHSPICVTQVTENSFSIFLFFHTRH